jgi:F420-dependent oxidoreductase-like protein
MSDMRIGVHICTFDWEGGPAAIRGTLADVVRDTEAAGFDFVTFMDHFMQAEGFMPPVDPIIEGYSALAYAAALTERVTLGMLVTGVLFRNPGVLAKTVTTLDVLSGGRAMLGIGGAWFAREHAAMGLAFPPPGERLGRMEEVVQICLQTWSDDDGPYTGRYFELAETMCSPPPITRPHPPIMIGGGGEQKTLRAVARYADIWNIASFPVDRIQHKLDVLRAHGDEVGRDTNEIRKTILWMDDPRDDEDGFRRGLDDYAALGFDAVFVMPYGADPRAAVAWLAEVLDK